MFSTKDFRHHPLLPVEVEKHFAIVQAKVEKLKKDLNKVGDRLDIIEHNKQKYINDTPFMHKWEEINKTFVVAQAHLQKIEKEMHTKDSKVLIRLEEELLTVEDQALMLAIKLFNAVQLEVVRKIEFAEITTQEKNEFLEHIYFTHANVDSLLKIMHDVHKHSTKHTSMLQVPTPHEVAPVQKHTQKTSPKTLSEQIEKYLNA